MSARLTPRTRADAGPSGRRESRQSRRALVARSLHAAAHQRLPRHRVHDRHARVPHHALESRRRRGLQHRRPEVRLLPGVRTPDHQSGHQLLDNCRGIVSRDRVTAIPGMGRSRHRVVDRPAHARHARRVGHRALTPEQTGFESQGAYRAAVAQPVGAPARQAGGRGCESRRWRARRRSRMEKAPDYESGSCRFDPCRRHPPRRSSAEQSAALRRRRPHVRIVPARLSLSPALVAQEREHVPGTDEVVGATPTEGPKEGIRPDEEPVCYAGTGRQPVWVRVPPLPLVEAIRLDEEPVPKTGRGREALGRSSRPASSTRRDGREVKTPGPQPGERGSSPRRGAHRQCQVVEREDVRLLPGRRGFEPLPGSATPGGRGFRRVAADRETRVRVPPGRPSQPCGRRPNGEDAGVPRRR